MADNKEVLRATKAALHETREVHRIPNGKLTRPNNIELGQPCKWNTDNSSSSTQPIELLNGATDSPFLGDIDDLHTLPSFSEVVADLTADEIAAIAWLVPREYSEYVDIFHPRLATESLAPSRIYDLKIELKEDAQLRAAPLYELSPTHVSILKETKDREHAAGRIRPSNAPNGSPTFFVPKSGGRHRMVVDFRRLNAATVPDAYPLPLISQITNELSKARYFTKLDLCGTYQLLRIAKGYEYLTALRTQFGMFESLVVRDGLCNAPAVFQHFLNEVFAELLGKGVIVYIDDILIYSDSVDELRRLTLLVFDRIRSTSLFLKA